MAVSNPGEAAVSAPLRTGPVARPTHPGSLARPAVRSHFCFRFRFSGRVHNQGGDVRPTVEVAPGVHSAAGRWFTAGIHQDFGRTTRAEKVKVTAALSVGRRTITAGRAGQTGSLYGRHPGPV